MSVSDELTCGTCVHAMKAKGVKLAVFCPFLQDWRALSQTCTPEQRRSIAAMLVGGGRNG